MPRLVAALIVIVHVVATTSLVTMAQLGVPAEARPGPLGGGVTLLAWLYARHADKPLSNVLPVAFYIAAAVVGVCAVLGGTSGGRNLGTWGGGGYDRAQRAAAVNMSAVLAFLAIVLFAFGLLLDYIS